jgi:photosystem II stability/assembly factor-like uncharacterized protein
MGIALSLGLYFCASSDVALEKEIAVNRHRWFPVALSVLALLCAVLGFPSPVAGGMGRWTLFGPGAGGISPRVFVGRTLFAYGGGGLYKSTDDGDSWTYVGYSPEGTLFNLFVLGPKHPGIFFGVTTSGRLVQSTDGAGSWSALHGPPGDVLTMAIVPSEPPTLLAAVSNVLWRSTDGGAHWAEIVHAPSTISEILVAPGWPPLVLLALRDTGILRSDNGGRSWTLIKRLTDGGEIEGIGGLTVAPSQPDTLYATGSTGRSFGLMKSEDSGRTWTFISDRVSGFVTVDPHDPTVLYTGGISDNSSPGGLWISRDSGGSWRQQRTIPLSFFGGDEVVSILFAPHTNALYVGTRSHGVAKSRDGGTTWTAGAQAGLFTGTWTTLQFRPGAPQDVFLVLDGLGDTLYSSTDGGVAWAPLARPDPYQSISALGLDPADPKLLYAGSYRGVWRSVDGGATWEHSLFLLSRPISFAFPAPGTVLAGMDQGVYRSTDRGLSWTPVLLPDGSPFSFNSHLVPDPTRPQTVYAWTEAIPQGLLQTWKSTDGGQTWRELPQHARALVIDPQNPLTLYAVEKPEFDRHELVVRTTDGGETWERLPSSGLRAPRVKINVLLVDTVTSTTLYAGTSEGVLRSQDGGATWTPLSPWGLVRRDRKIILGLAADPKVPHRIYALAEAGGAFEIQVLE